MGLPHLFAGSFHLGGLRHVRSWLLQVGYAVRKPNPYKEAR